MDILYDAADLLGRTLGSSPLWLLPLAVFWQPVLLLVHELGHATTALDLTDGRVGVVLGREPGMVRFSLGRCDFMLSPWLVSGGHCAYDPSRLRRGRDEAWIAAAGPIASLFTCLTLMALALMVESGHEGIGKLLAVGAIGAAGHFLFSALPLDYGAGLGASASDSDGRAVRRILTGYRPRERSDRVARHVFVVLLGLIGVLAFVMSPLLGLAVVAMFGLAWLMQRADPNH
jgi:peptidase M50-like protein